MVAGASGANAARAVKRAEMGIVLAVAVAPIRLRKAVAAIVMAMLSR